MEKKKGVERLRNGDSTDTKLKKEEKKSDKEEGEKRRNVVEFWGTRKWIITELPLNSDGGNGH